MRSGVFSLRCGVLKFQHGNVQEPLWLPLFEWLRAVYPLKSRLKQQACCTLKVAFSSQYSQESRTTKKNRTDRAQLRSNSGFIEKKSKFRSKLCPEICEFDDPLDCPSTNINLRILS